MVLDLTAKQEINLIRIKDYPEFLESAVKWFNSKWGIPLEVYRESIKKGIDRKNMIPQWYVVLNENCRIIAGAGIIENDFHERSDLTPNLCALYVEPEYRKQRIAKEILNYISSDISDLGYSRLYLLTDHKGFYERYDWTFLTMVKCNDGSVARVYEKRLITNC